MMRAYYSDVQERFVIGDETGALLAFTRQEFLALRDQMTQVLDGSATAETATGDATITLTPERRAILERAKVAYDNDVMTYGKRGVDAGWRLAGAFTVIDGLTHNRLHQMTWSHLLEWRRDDVDHSIQYRITPAGLAALDSHDGNTSAETDDETFRWFDGNLHYDGTNGAYALMVKTINEHLRAALARAEAAEQERDALRDERDHYKHWHGVNLRWLKFLYKQCDDGINECNTRAEEQLYRASEKLTLMEDVRRSMFIKVRAFLRMHSMTDERPFPPEPDDELEPIEFEA